MLTLRCDTAALRRNARYIRDASGTKLIAIVKHDAYGAGLSVAVKTLESEVDGFAAAEASEALRIRALSPKSRVMTLAPVYRDELCPALAGLVLSVDSAEIIGLLGGIYISMPGAVALRVDISDSGIGLCRRDFFAALAMLADTPNVRLAAVFAHCPSLYNSGGAAEMARRFGELAAAAQRFDRRCVCSIATSASWRTPELRFDAVRVGTNLDGLPSNERQPTKDLRPVLTLSTQLHSVFDAPGSLNFYDNCVELSGVRRAGVAAAGYGHLPALLHHQNLHALVRGRPARVLGSVSMSHLMLDLSAVPDAAPGDEVVFVGRSGAAEMTAARFAQCCAIPVCRCESSLFTGSCVRREII
ncbi:MAG: alanine racemase [Oscillospiraceae bacterium]|nr:alanine racemase [Oscillospiraceae bacterium]